MIKNKSLPIKTIKRVDIVKSRQSIGTLLNLMQGFDGCFIDFDEINLKNYEFTRVIWRKVGPKFLKLSPEIARFILEIWIYRRARADWAWSQIH